MATPPTAPDPYALTNQQTQINQQNATWNAATPVSEDLDEAIAAQIGQRTPATDRTGAASCRNAPRSAEACGRWCNQGVEVVGAPSRGRTGTPSFERPRILSPLCLPVSPPGRKLALSQGRAGTVRSAPGLHAANGRQWRRDPESNRAERICNHSMRTERSASS